MWSSFVHFALHIVLRFFGSARLRLDEFGRSNFLGFFQPIRKRHPFERRRVFFLLFSQKPLRYSSYSHKEPQTCEHHSTHLSRMRCRRFGSTLQRIFCGAMHRSEWYKHARFSTRIRLPVEGEGDHFIRAKPYDSRARARASITSGLKQQ